MYFGIVFALNTQNIPIRIIIFFAGLIACLVIGHCNRRIPKLFHKEGLIRSVIIRGRCDVPKAVIFFTHNGIPALTRCKRTIRDTEAFLHNMSGGIHYIYDLFI